MVDWFSAKCALDIVAFEASRDHCADASENLKSVPRLDLRQVALVGPDYPDPTVRLFKIAGSTGKGDSLFSARGDDYEVVPATRLSEVLRSGGYPIETVPVLLRMNIEGAEIFAIQDLGRCWTSYLYRRLLRHVGRPFEDRPAKRCRLPSPFER
jgi:FkbM family methyltransferase